MYQMSQRYSTNVSRGSVEYTTRSSSALEHTMNNEFTDSPKALKSADFVYANHIPMSRSYVLPTSINSSLRYIGASADSVPYSVSSGSYGITPTPHIEYHFEPDLFLKPGMHGTFVGKIEEIKEDIIETFEKIHGQEFPSDLKLSILDKNEFEKIAPGKGTIGLSFNRRQSGLISEIFVLNGPLARVMLTLGHELGHVLTPSLNCSKTEEAKAFAYSLEWMRIIKKHNIANLGDAFITEQPASNGLHDVAFSFVQKMIRRGLSAKEVYSDLVRGELLVGM